MLESGFMAARRVTRKQLKRQDQFVSTATRISAWVYRRRGRLGLVVLGLMAVAAGLVGMTIYGERREERAAAMLAVGLQIFRSPVGSSEPGAGGAETTSHAGDEHGGAGHRHFATETARYEAVVEALRPVVEEFAGSPSGQLAAYYLGISLSGLEEHDDAATVLHQASESSSPLVAAMAKYRLGMLQLQRRDDAEAIEAFGQLAAERGSGFPVEEALMAKGRAHQEAGDSQAAMVAYQRIVEEHAGSIYAAEARQKAEELAAQLGVSLEPESS